MANVWSAAKVGYSGKSYCSSADYYIIIPSLMAVGLSYWAVQYCLRAIAIAASYTGDAFVGALVM